MRPISVLQVASTEALSRGLLFILPHFARPPLSPCQASLSLCQASPVTLSPPLSPCRHPSRPVRSLVGFPRQPALCPWAKVFILSGLMIRLLSELERATLFTCSVNSLWRVSHLSDSPNLCVRSQGMWFCIVKGVTVEGCLSAQRCFISPQSFVQLVSVCRICQGQAFKFVWLGLHVSNLIVWNIVFTFGMG